jgi:FkbM family methyltransferase
MSVNPFVGKYLALRALSRMIRWLDNWPAVWSAYRNRQPLPALNFRRGFTLQHGQGDEPLLLLDEIFIEGCYSKRLRTDLKPRVIIDLGANIGAATLDWANQFREASIYAYEPNPGTTQTLRSNIEVNRLTDRVTIYDEAVGRENGEARLWSNVPSLLVSGYGDSPPSSGGELIHVPMVDLNEVVRRIGSDEVDLLKIDTEGAEADILEGANASTLNRINRVVLEYHDQLCPNAFSRCKNVLEQAGFKTRFSAINNHQGMLYAWHDHRR